MALGFDHSAAAQARGADPNPLGRAAYLGVDGAEIDVPAAFTHVVSVADGISKLRPFAANVANLCHDYSRKAQILTGKT